MLVMPSVQTKQERDYVLHDVAEKYSLRGYSVTIEPKEAERPDFLKPFEPDLLALSPKDSVIIEVKTDSIAQALRWKKLAELLYERPDWRLEYIYEAKQQDQISNAAAPLLNPEQIASMIATSRAVTKEGALEAGFLGAWAALAAAMRYVARHDPDGIEGGVRLESSLASTLYSEGWLDREVYDLIARTEQVRSQVIHGFHTDDLTPELTETLCSTTEQLMREWEDWKKKQEAA